MGTGAGATKNLNEYGKGGDPGAKYLKQCMAKLKCRGVPYPYLLISSRVRIFNVRYGITPHHPQQIFFVENGSVTTPEYVKLKKHAAEGQRAAAARKAPRKARTASQRVGREERMDVD
jgi:hypothetical protein